MNYINLEYKLDFKEDTNGTVAVILTVFIYEIQRYKRPQNELHYANTLRKHYIRHLDR